MISWQEDPFLRGPQRSIPQRPSRRRSSKHIETLFLHNPNRVAPPIAVHYAEICVYLCKCKSLLALR
jgi:hypothetical protein